MLKRFDNYDELYNSFRWSIPENYNIASDTIDKFSNSERIAIKHVLDDGNCNEFTFKYLQQKSNQLANVLDHLSLKNDDRVGIILGQCPETILNHADHIGSTSSLISFV